MLARLLVLILLSVGWVAPAFAASTIDTTQPVQGVPYSAAPILDNFGAAAADINAIESLNAGSSAPANPGLGTLWLNTSTTTYSLNIYVPASHSWLPIARIDSTGGIWMPPIGGGTLPSIVSAATTNLGSVPQAALNITGSQSIASFGSSTPAGQLKFLVFTGAPTLIYNSTFMILPGNANLSLSAGQSLVALSLGGGAWRVGFGSATACGIATTSVNGCVHPDGTTITIDGTGLIHAVSSGSVSSVGLSVPAASILGVTGSPVTTTGTLGLTTTGTSGGVPYFSSTSQLSTSALLTLNAPVIGGGAGAAPTVGSRSGNTTTFATTSGSLTNGHLAAFDGSGNVVDGGTIPAGTVTSVALSVPATSIFGVSGSPVTGSGTLGLTTTGTSGGIPYFSSTSQLATSAALTANLPVIGGGAGVAPSVGSRSGNTTEFGTVSGSLTSTHLLSADASGNIVDSGLVTPSCNGSPQIAFTNCNQTWVAQRGLRASPALSTATFTPNFDSVQQQLFSLTSACPCTIANPSTTLVEGQAGMFTFVQDGTGSRTIGTWGSDYVYVGGTSTIALSAAASTRTYIWYQVNDAGQIVLGAPVSNPTH